MLKAICADAPKLTAAIALSASGAKSCRIV
jgi:hypothetical protein